MPDTPDRLITRYVPISRKIGTTGSIKGGSSLIQDLTIELKGDTDSPEPHSFYGTDIFGERGWVQIDLENLVHGPTNSTDLAYARFDGTTGTLLRDSQLTSDGAGTLMATHLASAQGVQSSTIVMTSNYGGGAPLNDFGTFLGYNLETSTTNGVEAGRIGVAWSDVTHATRTSYMDFWIVNNANPPEVMMRLWPTNSLSVGHTTQPPNGVISASAGFRDKSTAASSGSILQAGGSGIFAESPFTIPGIPGSSGNVMTSDGSNWISSAPSVTATNTVTITNKRITKRSTSLVAVSSLSPDISAFDVYVVTGLNASLTINAPTGTPVAGDEITISLSDNGTPRALTWNGIFKGTLPANTTVGSTNVVKCVFTNTQWRVEVNQIS